MVVLKVFGAVLRLKEPRLLKFAPGLALPPSPPNPAAVVPAKVELLKVRPTVVALCTRSAAGTETAGSAPSDEDFIGSSGAVARRQKRQGCEARTSCFVVSRISDFMMCFFLPVTGRVMTDGTPHTNLC